MELSLILLFGLLVLTTWIWSSSLEAREAANRAALEACSELSLQMLDGTVSFRALRPRRQRGKWRLERTYEFEYTHDGSTRRRALVLVNGGKVDSLLFPHDERARPSVAGDQPH